VKTTVVNIRQESCDVYIGRPTKWGNPFQIGKDGTRAEVITKYRQRLLERPELIAEARKVLKGKRLGCFCKPKACHGDVLVEFIEHGNKPIREGTLIKSITPNRGRMKGQQ